MNKKWLYFWLLLFIVLIPVCHAAVDANGQLMSDSSAAIATVPVIPAEPGHWWSALLATVLSAVASALTALVVWISNNVKKWMEQKASEQNTKESYSWYKTASFFAAIAINAAKKKYGPGTATAEQVVSSAKDFLRGRLAAIDPDILDPKKNPELDKILEGLLYAVYDLPFEVTAPLVAAPAPKP